jgi:hypothetical protein
LAPLQIPLTGQMLSFAQPSVLHSALTHTPPVPQFVSTLQAPVHFLLGLVPVHVAPPVQSRLDVQLPTGAVQVPFCAVATPHAPLSQSEFLWQVVVVPVLHVPAVAPVPVPHRLLSQSALTWQALVPHLPTVDPTPAPHEPLSHCALLWQTRLAPAEHAPATEPVPTPQELLSQSASA